MPSPADVALLPRTDVTYIVSSAESRIGLQNTSDMVRSVGTHRGLGVGEDAVALDLHPVLSVSGQDELRSMSAEQRANQAMNLMLYNVYSGPGTSASANL